MTQTGTDAEVFEAVAKIADHLIEHSPTIVESILTASRVEIPEYAKLDDESQQRQRARNLWGIQMMASMIRAGRGTFDRNEREFLLTVGAEVANEPEPLHAVIRTFQIAAREMVDSVLEIAPDLGPASGSAIAVAFRTGSSLLSVLVEAVEVGFANNASARGDQPDQAKTLVTDLVLGVAKETFAPRALFAGLEQRAWYRAVVAVCGNQDVPAPWPEDVDRWVRQALPSGAIFGTLGHAGIVVASGSESADPAQQIADMIEREITERVDHVVSTSIGPPVSSLADVHESFNVAFAVAEAARGQGRPGRSTTLHMTVPRLVTAARAAGIDLIDVIDPILASSTAPESVAVLRAYIAAGCSVQDGAMKLHMHRNTLRRKLQAIEALLGFAVVDRWAEVELALAALPVRPGEILR